MRCGGGVSGRKVEVDGGEYGWWDGEVQSTILSNFCGGIVFFFPLQLILHKVKHQKEKKKRKK